MLENHNSRHREQSPQYYSFKNPVFASCWSILKIQKLLFYLFTAVEWAWRFFSVAFGVLFKKKLFLLLSLQVVGTEVKRKLFRALIHLKIIQRKSKDTTVKNRMAAREKSQNIWDSTRQAKESKNTREKNTNGNFYIWKRHDKIKSHVEYLLLYYFVPL